MDNIQATPRNTYLGKFADVLKQGKSVANTYAMKDWVPLIGGMGLGDMFMGKAPELVDDISYDGLQAAIRGGNAATGGIGTYGARPAVADAALLGMDALGLAKGLGALTKAGGMAAANRLTGGTTNSSRREFMKKAAALAGSTAAAGTGVGLLRKFGDNALVDVAPKVADNVTAQVPKQFRFNSLSDYMENVFKRQKEEDLFNDPDMFDYDMRRILQGDADAYSEANYILGGSPESWENSVQNNTFSPQAKQEMKNWKARHGDLWNDFSFDRSLDLHELGMGMYK